MVHSEEWKQNWKKPEIKHNIPTKWNWIVAHPDHLNLGKYVDIGAFTYINAKYIVTIDDDVQIGSHVAIYTENTIDDTWGHVYLEKGCCIGSHSIILPGVIVGYKAKVGAFSLVKKDIPANSTAYGIPMKVVKKF
ncbi:MAG: acyltransferase [Methanolobus sp.]|uniref:acyltransferase n=1 Tax=Methanolobus sp. TaxID=1874737 RepID=UPI002731D64A|nr:acyltransferase [Methanolobus sp.]MDP2217211.1 acyltransferase [Methanolobus sp.]